MSTFIFWIKKNYEVVSRYLTSEFLGHSKALEKAIIKLSTKKCIQISIDSPNVNHKMQRDFKEKLETYIIQ